MDIEDVATQQQILNEQIKQAVTNFKRSTGLHVAEIRLEGSCFTTQCGTTSQIFVHTTITAIA